MQHQKSPCHRTKERLLNAYSQGASPLPWLYTLVVILAETDSDVVHYTQLSNMSPLALPGNLWLKRLEVTTC